MARPLCRWCGKPIAKYTSWKTLTTDLGSMKYDPARKVLVEKLPQTKAEAQALFNLEVVAVQRAKEFNTESDTVVDVGIRSVSLWDGQTYVDKFFCSKTTCAVAMGYAGARQHGLTTKAYREALEAQQKGDQNAVS